MKTNYDLSLEYAQNCIDNAGVAYGVCCGFVAIVHAVLYKKNESEGDLKQVHQFSSLCIRYANQAPGICYGLAAIAYAIIS